MELTEKMTAYMQRVNEEIEALSQVPDCLQKNLMEAQKYSLCAGGKRIRPVLLLAACEMAGGRLDDALPFAIGLEMIHNSSLIHDDLPAMDNDDLRRGKPTNHKVFGEATAILAGDVLLVKPFALMAAHASTQAHIRAMQIIAEAAGDHGMMGGQQIDLDWEGKQADVDTILTLNKLKTGALFRAAVTAGAVLGGASQEQIRRVDQYGSYLGLAFQLRDDLLDSQPDFVTGKTTGSDEKSGKSTYLAVYGPERCREMIAECTQKAVSSLAVFEDKAAFLTQLVQGLEYREN